MKQKTFNKNLASLLCLSFQMTSVFGTAAPRIILLLHFMIFSRCLKFCYISGNFLLKFITWHNVTSYPVTKRPNNIWIKNTLWRIPLILSFVQSTEHDASCKQNKTLEVIAPPIGSDLSVAPVQTGFWCKKPQLVLIYMSGSSFLIVKNIGEYLNHACTN